MAKIIVSEYLNLINNQIIEQERLLEYHSKLSATFKVVLCDHFFEQSMEVMHNCLWGLSDIADQAKALNEQLLAALHRWPLTPSNDPEI